MICKSHDIIRDFVRVQAYGHYNVVIRIYGHHNVVSFSEISWDFSKKWDVWENLWCLWCLKDTTLWCLLVKSHEILAWNEMCERVCGVCGVYYPNLMRFEHETRNVGDFMVKMGLCTPQTPQTLLHISFHAKISRDLTYRHHNVVSFRHHELFCTSCFMPKSHDIWLIDTTGW